jgi:DNA-binding response OmpR family regulator
LTNKPTVLIVEDNIDLAEATKHFLEIKRFRVLISNGKDLFNIIEEQKPDVIILDIFLGALDGRVLCKQIKQGEKIKHIPVIMLSAHDKLSKAYDDNCADGYIMKPFALAELLSEIELLIKMPEHQ